ncbi:MAG: S41 family peptidase, partial [Ruminiclostridium sp.]|nr:S41 family peptidase [Ruminiclostridium sp.]
MKSKRYWLFAIICVLVAIAFFAAGFFAYSFVNLLNPKYSIQFSQDVSRENIINFNQVKSMLMKNYYQPVDENVLLEGAIQGMAEAMDDPYTVYYTPDQMKDFKEKAGGTYVGIGVTM